MKKKIGMQVEKAEKTPNKTWLTLLVIYRPCIIFTYLKNTQGQINGAIYQT